MNGRRPKYLYTTSTQWTSDNPTTDWIETFLFYFESILWKIYPKKPPWSIDVPAKLPNTGSPFVVHPIHFCEIHTETFTFFTDLSLACRLEELSPRWNCRSKMLPQRWHATNWEFVSANEGRSLLRYRLVPFKALRPLIDPLDGPVKTPWFVVPR